MRIQPRPEVGVDEIHADRLGLDHHLAGLRGRLRLVDEGKNLRSAGVLDSIACMFKDSNGATGWVNPGWSPGRGIL